MSLTLLSWEEFDQFANQVTLRGFEQSSEMARLLEKRGYQVQALGYLDANKTIKVAAILYSQSMTGGLKSQIHYGPLFDDVADLPHFLNGLIASVKEDKRILELTVQPYTIYQTFDNDKQPLSPKNEQLLAIFQQAGFDYQGVRQDYEGGGWHYAKQLEGLTPKSLRASFSKKGKALVKKANTFGITIRSLKRHELKEFKAVTEATSDRRAFNDKPLSYYEYLYDSFADKAVFLVASLNFQDYLTHLQGDQDKLKQKIQQLEQSLVQNPQSEKKQNQLRELSSQAETFEVRKNEAKHLIQEYGNQDVILAGSLFIFMPQETTYFLSGSYPEFNKFYAPALLQEYIMLESIERGIPKYNFLGIKGVFDGSDSILRFKQNFNGYIEQHYGSFTYSLRPYKMKWLRLLKRLLKR